MVTSHRLAHIKCLNGIFLAAACLMTVGCSQVQNIRATNLLPTSKASDIQTLATISGTLKQSNNCIRLQTGGDQSYLLIWPQQTILLIEGASKSVEIPPRTSIPLDRNLTLKGGVVSGISSAYDQNTARILKECGGPFFLTYGHED